jgi:hypothetical protein
MTQHSTSGCCEANGQTLGRKGFSAESRSSSLMVGKRTWIATSRRSERAGFKGLAELQDSCGSGHVEAGMGSGVGGVELMGVLGGRVGTGLVKTEGSGLKPGKVPEPGAKTRKVGSRPGKVEAWAAQLLARGRAGRRNRGHGGSDRTAGKGGGN